MNRSQYEHILAQSLEALEAGGSPQSIAAQHPEFESELLRALIVAEALPALRLEPSGVSEARSRRALLEAAERQQRGRVLTLPRQRFRLPAAAQLVALALLIVGVLVLGAATRALPGDTLYATKLQMEAVQLNLARQREAVEAAQREERLEEVKRLIAREESQPVRFEGRIEAVLPGVMRIAGVDVWLTGATTVVGEPEIGRAATVSGLTGVAGVTAGRVEIASAGRTETPAETLAPPPTATDPPAPSTPDIAVTPKPTAGGESLGQPTQTPTLTPAPPVPTATPADDDDGSDDEAGDDTSGERSGPGNGSGSGGDDSGSGGSDSGSASGGDDHDDEEDDATDEPDDDSEEEGPGEKDDEPDD